MNDLAESQLLKAVKDGNMSAIAFWLRSRHTSYSNKLEIVDIPEREELTKEQKSRVGVYIGITEHGNVETEHEIYNIAQYNYDVKYWTHHHNPRTVANNPAGEVTLNLEITGPHYCMGAACAAGNIGITQG